VAARPSEPLLSLLRDVVRKKGLTTAQLAEKLHVERSLLKQQLAGTQPLTIDDFILLSQALELTPEELGVLPALDRPAAPAEATDAPSGDAPPADGPRLKPVSLARVEEADEAPPPGPDPLGNLPRQVLQLGFALGIDLFLLLDAKQLANSNVPADTRSRFPETLPIKLEARYHRHNRPRFEDDAFECVLSFDKLYTCRFPWTAFRQVHFNLPEMASEPEPAPPPKPAGPFLRLVK
jgi:transcriptional regulator with XRE-family HTH domain